MSGKFTGLTGLLSIHVKTAVDLQAHKQNETYISLECVSIDQKQVVGKLKANREGNIVNWDENVDCRLKEAVGLRFRVFVKDGSLNKKEIDIGDVFTDLIKHFKTCGYNQENYTYSIHPYGKLSASLQFLSAENLLDPKNLNRHKSFGIGSQKLEGKTTDLSLSGSMTLKGSAKTAAKNMFKRSASQQDLKTPKTFGGELSKLAKPETQYVPMIMIDCIVQVEEWGMETEGIYRLSGNKNVIDELKSLINAGKRVNLTPLVDTLKCGKQINIHAVSCLLKQFFNDLQQPLMTEELYLEFLKCANLENGPEKNANIVELIKKLPKENFSTFAFLMNHLRRVESHKEKNSMSFNALSTCFGPATFKCENITKWKPQQTNALLEYTLENWDEIFCGENTVSELSQFVPKIDRIVTEKREEVRLHEVPEKSKGLNNDFDYDENLQQNDKDEFNYDEDDPDNPFNGDFSDGEWNEDGLHHHYNYQPPPPPEEYEQDHDYDNNPYDNDPQQDNDYDNNAYNNNNAYYSNSSGSQDEDIYANQAQALEHRSSDIIQNDDIYDNMGTYQNYSSSQTPESEDVDEDDPNVKYANELSAYYEQIVEDYKAKNEELQNEVNRGFVKIKTLENELEFTIRKKNEKIRKKESEIRKRDLEIESLKTLLKSKDLENKELQKKALEILSKVRKDMKRNNSDPNILGNNSNENSQTSPRGSRPNTPLPPTPTRSVSAKPAFKPTVPKRTVTKPTTQIISDQIKNSDEGDHNEDLSVNDKIKIFQGAKN